MTRERDYTAEYDDAGTTPIPVDSAGSKPCPQV